VKVKVKVKVFSDFCVEYLLVLLAFWLQCVRLILSHGYNDISDKNDIGHDSSQTTSQ
jgi:hypothetical protein